MYHMAQLLYVISYTNSYVELMNLRTWCYVQSTGVIASMNLLFVKNGNPYYIHNDIVQSNIYSLVILVNKFTLVNFQPKCHKICIRYIFIYILLIYIQFQVDLFYFYIQIIFSIAIVLFLVLLLLSLLFLS